MSKKIIVDIIIAVVLAIIAAIIVEKLHLDTYILIIIILSIIIVTLIYEMVDLYKRKNIFEIEIERRKEEVERIKSEICNISEIGIERIIEEKRQILQEKATFLLDARERICILGASVSSFWEGNKIFTDYLAEAGRKNVLIEILILSPESNSTYLKNRADAEGLTEETLRNKINDSINQFNAFRKKNNIQRMDLYIYNESPVWHMIIIDSVYARISYYPSGKQGNDAPYYILNNKGKYKLIEPFIMHFNALKDISIKVDFSKYDKFQKRE